MLGNILSVVFGFILGGAFIFLWLRAKYLLEIQSLKDRLSIASEKEIFFNKANEQLSSTFKALSSEVLQSNNQSFLDLAKTQLETFQEKAKLDLTKRQENILELVKPVKETLEKVDLKISDFEKSRSRADESLYQQVKSLLETQKELKTETTNLVTALRAPQGRGRWGEIQLKRVVEMAGMLEHCDFFQQESVSTEEGRLRPDLIVRLPGGKNIVVDAKTPLSAYLSALEENQIDRKKEKLLDHARQVRQHLAQLSRKSYWDQFQPTPEFVVLFLPGEAFFSAALEMDPSLIELGVSQNVIIATPTTLIALLRSVAYGWRQERVAENAKMISDLGKELYKRVSDMSSHMERLGRNLEGAVDSYNKTVGSLETRILVSARRFRDLDQGIGGVIESLPTVNQQPRALQSPEFTDRPS